MQKYPSKTNSATKEKKKRTRNFSKKNSQTIVTLNLKISAELRRDIKLFATEKDMAMVDVIKEAYQLYKERKK